MCFVKKKSIVTLYENSIIFDKRCFSVDKLQTNKLWKVENHDL